MPGGGPIGGGSTWPAQQQPASHDSGELWLDVSSYLISMAACIPPLD